MLRSPIVLPRTYAGVALGCILQVTVEAAAAAAALTASAQESTEHAAHAAEGGFQELQRQQWCALHVLLDGD